MNGDALSDLVLALACAGSVPIARRAGGRTPPAFALAAAVIVAASTLGIARFSGAAWALAPHRALSALGAFVSFPLLAADAYAPGAPFVRRWKASCGVAAALAGVGACAALAGVSGLRAAFAVVSLVVVAWSAWRDRSGARAVASCALAASFAVAARARGDAPVCGPFDAVQLMHVGFAIVFVALAVARRRAPSSG